MSLDEIIRQNNSNQSRKNGKPSKTFKRRHNKVPENKHNSTSGVIRNRGHGSIVRKNKGFQQLHNHRVSFRAEENKNQRYLEDDGTELNVCNLNYQLTDKDIFELFRVIGPLKSANICYDKNGKSLGSAKIIYKHRTDAEKALKYFNGETLDGRKMRIRILVSKVQVNQSIRNGLGNNFKNQQIKRHDIPNNNNIRDTLKPNDIPNNDDTRNMYKQEKQPSRADVLNAKLKELLAQEGEDMDVD